MSAVSLRSIHKQFGAQTPVIQGLDLDIAPGEFMVFVGPSGSGKSTLLRIIAGLETASGGRLHINGRDRTDSAPSERDVAMVFQSYALYPHMTARENMGFALKMAGLPRAEVQARVAQSAEVLQITHLLDRKPKTLSGGQRQRVAIGRAIVRKPAVFLFDEPLSNLDAALRQDMRIEIARLHAELGSTMIYVTHDQVEAMTLADRIAVFEGGVVQQVGTPQQLYQAPANRFVAGFLGSPKINWLPGRLLDGASAQVEIPGLGTLAARPLQPGVSAGQPVSLGIRPEHLQWLGEGEAADNSLPARLQLIEYLGDHVLAHVRVVTAEADLALCLKLPHPPAGAELGRGSALRLRLAPEHGLLFDATGRALFA